VGKLVDGSLDIADLSDLAPDVEVDHIEAVGHPVLPEVLNGVEEFGHTEPEFGAHPARAFPAAGALCARLGANPDAGSHVVLFRVADDPLEVTEALNYGDDVPTELGGQDHGLDELAVLESVADDGHRGQVFGEPENGKKLWLAPGFETEPEFFPDVTDFLAELSLLIDLDGVHAAIRSGVLVLSDSGVECLADLAEAVLEKIPKADDDWGPDLTLAEPLDHFV